jgi:hypothetical protein
MDQTENKSAKGGKARAESLTAAERSDIARKAALERWGTKEMQPDHGTLVGVLPVGGIPCAVLPDGTRVISERGMMRALGGKRGGSHWRRRKSADGGADLPVYLSARNLRPFIDDDLEAALKSPISHADGRLGNWMLATLVPDICNVYLKARDAKSLHKSQEGIATAADLIMRALAHVGIVALVDEVTGYQAHRAKDALSRVLYRFIARELRKWVKTFPDDFYREMFRLRGWNYSDVSSARPQVVAYYTNNVVYDRLAPGVRRRLNELTPRDEKGRLKDKLHQRLSEEVGHPALREHLAACVALMKASRTWEGFIRLLDLALPRYGDTLSLPLDDSQ